MAKERFVARKADFCGNPNEITAQVLQANTDLVGINCLICYVDCGGMAGAQVLDSVQLFPETIIPAVDEVLVQ